MFCLVYEKTGTLYTTIGLHALNNSIAYGAEVDSAAVSLVLGSLMLTGCMLGPRLLHPRIATA
jgi:membrane protease YdiL (CAAX protease family)